MKMKTTISSTIIATIMIIMTTTTTAYGQPQVDPYQPVIMPGGEFVTAIVENARSLCTGVSDKSACVNTVFASDRVVVLTGEYLPEIAGSDLRGNNPMLWIAVDEIVRTQGFAVQGVTMSGTGLEVNPNVYTVVMTK